MADLTAEKIIQLLDQPTDDRRPVRDQILREAPITQIVKAVQMKSTASTRQILCDILGELASPIAIAALLATLDDKSPGVRDSAAEALGKIGDPTAGGALMRQFVAEEDVSLRQTLAVSLGAVGYRWATPLLIEALDQSNATLRGCAAWSLGRLGATEAVESLQHALSVETDQYALARLREAIDLIERRR